MTRLSKHAEWLSLIEVSGPFLALPVLERAFPQGLDPVPADKTKKIRLAYDEWIEAIEDEDEQLPALHAAWLRLVLNDLLEYDEEVLKQGPELPATLSYVPPDGGEKIVPDSAVIYGDDVKLLILTFPIGTDLEVMSRKSSILASPIERMTTLCRATSVRLGLVTNGEKWVLVNAPIGETAGYVSWYARLWQAEPVTLKAFHSLLAVRRFFGPVEERLDSLLQESLNFQEEVTDTLGEQVRNAVEVLIQALDRADVDRNRELLREVSPSELYEAGLTVMMRLVFILCAEERRLLLLGDPVYDQHYAISTLRAQLAEEAALHGTEILERRHDAWSRLLATFRAVYGGIEHETLRLAALDGTLFNPDRFPFLEGRTKGTNWRKDSAVPLPVDNRTVLMLLNALQVLDQPAGALLLSYKALDVEQIGHVYEGLLEHTVERLPSTTLGLTGSQKCRNPSVPLALMESAKLDGESALISTLTEKTGRSEAAIRNALAKDCDEATYGRLLQSCRGDSSLALRIKPFVNLIRIDSWGNPSVQHENAFAVTLGSDRRETGTHYTPKTLTEKIVETTLEPLVYKGPSEGISRDKWCLSSPNEILDLKVCDPAMGSGAFLVQVCRWLGERLVESWEQEEKNGQYVTVNGDVVNDLKNHEPLPTSLTDRILVARRLIAERCLYGVDVNPLAVELAKLSIWLITLARGRPFGFLDHNLRSGDSLLGIHHVEQLARMSMVPSQNGTGLPLFEQAILDAISAAIDIRLRLREIPIRDISDVEKMAKMDAEARKILYRPEVVADNLLERSFQSRNNKIPSNEVLSKIQLDAGNYLTGAGNEDFKIKYTPKEKIGISRRLFHWPLEFPEVFLRKNGGFDALVFNPPFLGGTKISGSLGQQYLAFLKEHYKSSQNTDLCAYFVQRALQLCRSNSHVGFIATKTISQGDTREASLDVTVESSARIYCALPAIPWPGKAAVHVSLVWIEASKSLKQALLDGVPVENISPYLTAGSEEQLKIGKLNQRFKSFKGVMVSGNDLFAVSETERSEYLKDDPKNEEVIKPFLVGADLTTSPNCNPSRLIIDFADLSEAAAQKYRKPYQHTHQRVRPFRQTVNRKSHRERWWQYGDTRQGLRRSIRNLNRVLVSPQTSKYLFFVWCPTTWVFDQKCVVIATERDDVFGVLNSEIFNVWTRHHCATRGDTLSFTPSDAYETFPFPTTFDDLAVVAKRFNQLRIEICSSEGIGFTTLFNRFHDKTSGATKYVELRNAYAEMSRQLVALYGWDDLDLEFDFREVSYLYGFDKVRFAVQEPQRMEILRRLEILNHEITKVEVVTKKTPKRRTIQTKSKPQTTTSDVKAQLELLGEKQGNRKGMKGEENE